MKKIRPVEVVAAPIVIDSKGLEVTLETYHKELGEDTVSMRTLQRWAKAGAIPGAWKPKGARMWLVNKLENYHANQTIPQPSFPEIPPPPQKIKDGTAIPLGKKSSNAKKGQVGDGFDNFDISRRVKISAAKT